MGSFGVHYVADFVLGVEAAVADSVALTVVSCGLVPPGSDLGQAGERLDLDAPALVLGEMPVEAVLLVHRHHIEEFLYGLHGIEVAAAVELHSAPGDPGGVLYAAALRLPGNIRDGFVGVCRSGQQLAEGLQAVEGAGGIGGIDLDAAAADGEPVTLCGLVFILLEDNRAAEEVAFRRKTVPGGHGHFLAEVRRNFVELGAMRYYRGAGAESETAAFLHNRSGLRNDGDGEQYGEQELHLEHFLYCFLYGLAICGGHIG